MLLNAAAITKSWAGNYAQNFHCFQKELPRIDAGCSFSQSLKLE